MLIATNLYNQDLQLPCSMVLGDEYDTCIENNIVLDLINVFCAVYIADITTVLADVRHINVTAPVSVEHIQVWNECKGLILRLLKFVTEGDNDEWDISFFPVIYQFPPKQLVLEDFYPTVYDNISLLSGGLDSFCGVFENGIHNCTSLYCGYKISTIDDSYISRVFKFANQVNPQTRLCKFNRVSANKITYTQRTRSLLFFSLACFLAIWKGIKVVKVHENGIMTLNPSFESRGTTKTTHPKTIFLYQKLLHTIGIDVILKQPFLFYTKGEMVSDLSQQYREHICNTRSCSRSLQNIRYRKKGITSCGACVPCLLRKISLAAYDMEAYDNEYYIPYEGDFTDEEYSSAFSYYERFSRAIDNDTILSNFEIRKAYYSEPDYYEKTYSLLKRFNIELKAFFDKYGR